MRKIARVVWIWLPEAQLEEQGVTVDRKMLEIMASLNQEEAVSPLAKKSGAMADMERVLHRDEDED